MTDAPPEVLRAVIEVLQPLVPESLKANIQPDSSLVNDLGMDSLKVVELSLGLEEKLGYPVFLPAWIAASSDPSDLTVASLAEFAAGEQ